MKKDEMTETLICKVTPEFKNAIDSYIKRLNEKNNHLQPLTVSILIRAALASVIFRKRSKKQWKIN